jgi:hypothetical protein
MFCTTDIIRDISTFNPAVDLDHPSSQKERGPQVHTEYELIYMDEEMGRGGVNTRTDEEEG